MIILEYKMHADKLSPIGIKHPDWLSEWGFWPGINNTFIGMVKDNHTFYIPSTVTRLTSQQLEDRQVAIHNNKTMLNDISGTPIELSESDVRNLIQGWIIEKEESIN